MVARISQGIELLPDDDSVRQLFILLHGVGAKPSDLLPLAYQLRKAFPDAAFVLPEGHSRFDGRGDGLQWFSISER